MDDIDPMHELMQDLQRSLYEAFDRAKAGEATEQDWKLIRDNLRP
jgi:hypothetical protein